MILIKVDNIVCEFIGMIRKIPRKRDRKVQSTIYGEKRSIFTRGVKDLTINVGNISEEEFENLERIFLKHNNNIIIVDTSDGKQYNKMFIDSNEINFERQKDYNTNTYYYTGTLSISRT